jgi:hypothetical protein
LAILLSMRLQYVSKGGYEKLSVQSRLADKVVQM